MTTLTVTGASDDLIEIDGCIREEFNLHDDENGDLLVFSDGTVLRIHYSAQGIWRISVVWKGTATVTIEQAPENDEDNYSDRATFDQDVAWVVHGIAHAVRPKS